MKSIVYYKLHFTKKGFGKVNMQLQHLASLCITCPDCEVPCSEKPICIRTQTGTFCLCERCLVFRHVGYRVCLVFTVQNASNLKTQEPLAELCAICRSIWSLKRICLPKPSISLFYTILAGISTKVRAWVANLS